MRCAIVKVHNHGAEKKWIPIIKLLQEAGQTIYREYPKSSDCNIVLSGQFENPRGGKGKRILILDRREWVPDYTGWEFMYRDIVKHYYDEIVDVTDMTFGQTAEKILEVYNAEKRKADKS